MDKSVNAEQVVQASENGEDKTTQPCNTFDTTTNADTQQIDVAEDFSSEKTTSAYKKFGSIDKLVKAYESLEAEFTKRSQKLKELEKRSEQKALSEDEINTLVQTRLMDEQFIESIAADERISDLIISRYLRSISGIKATPVLGATFGKSVLTPIKKPKSLEQAKALADLMLNG